MSRRVCLSPTARRDLAAAFRWHQRQTPSAGNVFLSRYQQSLERIGRRPESYRILVDALRCALLRPFRYAVLYRVEGQVIRVLGILPLQIAVAKLPDKSHPSKAEQAGD